jgi:signal transduction histidine kinase
LSRRLEQLNTGDELQRLSDTLNQMLGRIETSFLRVSQFTADASHELRTPISLIRTESEIALRKTRSEVEYQEALRHILQEAEGTSSLIEKLLALARADAGREALDIGPLDLRSTVLQATHDWANAMATHDLRFTSFIGDREIFVTADQTAIQRLLNILLDNAVRYTPATGTVDLKLEQNGDHAIIAVGDTGIGIRGEEQSRIFERFYRVDKVRNHRHAGAGLGLSIARWIVEQHRGSIAVHSSLGKGSRFIVSLPVQEPLPEKM